MDTFASIALAANSSQESHKEPLLDGGQHRGFLVPAQSCLERPSKRARSEKLPSPEWRRTVSRPMTSYIQPIDERREDAELLLNFFQGARYAVPKLPTYRPVQSEFPYRRSPSQETFPLSALQSPIQKERFRTDESPHNYAARRQPTNRQKATNPVSVKVDNQATIGAGAIEGSLFASKNSLAVESPTQDKMVIMSDASTQSSFQQHAKEPPSLEKPPSPPESNADDSLMKEVNQDSSIILDTLDEQGHVQGGKLVGEVAADTAAEHNINIAHTNVEDPTPAPKLPLEEKNTDMNAEVGVLDSAGSPTRSPVTLNVIPAPMPELLEPPKIPPEPSVPKQRQSLVPSVCAACNFSRNTLTIETENDATSWISCDGCKSWFHFACAGFKNEREVRSVDKYRCKKCKPVHGATTYVRKSTRAHSAIDYAGLNEGVLKTSDENPEHHYIKPIKEGVIKFHPDNFARMRPELVTADYFEKGDGMKEPIVIPASLNPRPPPISHPEKEVLDGDDHSSEQTVPEHLLSGDFECETVPDHGQDALDMVIPQGLTVRQVSELYGPEEKVEVIDVKSQNGEDKKWNMRRWVDYYESQGNKVVRNVISLEVSQSKLGRLIRRPKIVRDLDLQDSVWPAELQAKGDFPKVQFYCLMSVADCFTDFHIDFGGSSVFYHILKGKKTFFFIPPHEKHLKKYEEWCMSPAQNWTFLGDQTKECYRVDLSEGDTMLIPAGWIHAVWTPEDSLVIGGNFLTRTHYQMQIRVAQIEKATGVARKFRYPQFQKVLWYTALKYLEEDPLPDSVSESLLAGQTFHREHPTSDEFYTWGDSSVPGAENYHARYYSKAELDGLPELARYLQRTALIAMGHITEGISVETRNAVKRSIPKLQGEPLDAVKKFALWYTWKRGNEPIPHWAYPNHIPEGGAPELTEKKLSVKALRRLDREAALQAYRVAPDRQSTRRKPQQTDTATDLGLSGQSTPASSGLPATEINGTLKRKLVDLKALDAASDSASVTPKKPRLTSTTGSSKPRKVACESCRKRRRACKHREEAVVHPSGGENDAVGNSIITSRPILEKPDGEQAGVLDDGPSHGLQAGEQGLIESAEHSKYALNEDFSMRQMLHVEIPRNDTSQGLLPISGSAATSRSNVQIVLPPATGSPSTIKTLDLSYISPLKTPGRSKACKDCRKSKRRCVHDENGNEDPIKVKESAVPRPTTSKKRKVSVEGSECTNLKKVSITENEGVVRQRQETGASQSPNGQIIRSRKPITAPPKPVYYPRHVHHPIQVAVMTSQDPFTMLPPPNHFNLELTENHTTLAHQALKQIVPDPASPCDSRSLLNYSNPITGTTFTQPLSTQPLEPPEPPEEVQLIATSPLSPLKLEDDFSLLSNEPAASSLVSPPASLHTDNESPPSPAPSTSDITGFTSSVSTTRQSSRHAKAVQRYTPESGPARRASSSSMGGRTTGRQSSMGGRTTERESASPAVQKKGRMASEATVTAAPSAAVAVTDEESLALIRELQAQEYGLRRRRT
ncbi:MAG: hypothetical protein Q9187_004697 [Circinaria calcarea]